MLWGEGIACAFRNCARLWLIELAKRTKSRYSLQGVAVHVHLSFVLDMWWQAAYIFNRSCCHGNGHLKTAPKSDRGTANVFMWLSKPIDAPRTLCSISDLCI